MPFGWISIYPMNLKTTKILLYYARNELYEELAVRVFGIYALKL